MLALILQILALVLCLVGAFVNPPRCNLTSLGLAFYFASILVGKNL